MVLHLRVQVRESTDTLQKQKVEVVFFHSEIAKRNALLGAPRTRVRTQPRAHA